MKPTQGLLAFSFLLLALVSRQAHAGFLYAFQDDPLLSTKIHGFSVNESTGGLTALAAFPISTLEVGSLDETAERMAIDATNARLYVVNDLTNKVNVFSINTVTGALTALSHSPFSLGAGSWMCIAVHQSGSPVVVGDSAGRLASFNVTERSATAASGNPFTTGSATPVSVAFSRDGNFVYTGGNSGTFVAGFRVNATTGVLTALAGSPFDSGFSRPRAYATDDAGRIFAAQFFSPKVLAFTTSSGIPSGVSGNPFPSGLCESLHGLVLSSRFYVVADFDCDKVGVFQIIGSGSSTTLSAIELSPFSVPGTAPGILALNVGSQFLFVANRSSRNISAFSVNTTSGNLTHVATQPRDTLGNAGSITGMGYIPTSDVPPFPVFTDAAPALLSTGFTHASAWGDFNNDGRPDLFVAAEAGGVNDDRLFRNDGSGNFTDVTTLAGITRGGSGNARAAICGDFDNDNDLDLFVLNDPGPHLLYRNRGAPVFTFTEEAAARGIAGNNQSFGSSAVWGDFDRDGDLDLYIANASQDPNEYFVNSGSPDFTFTESADQVGLTEPRLKSSIDVCAGDFDGDGDLDLFVAGESFSGLETPNQLYRNLGDGTFENVASNFRVDTSPTFIFCSAWGDIDNDGDLDLFLGGTNKIVLLRNDGNLFSDVTASVGLPATLTQTVQACQMVDMDFDGLLDLLVGGSSTFMAFQNANSGTSFTNRSSSFNAQTDAILSITVADLDQDNDLDAYVGSDSSTGNRLFLNGGTGLNRFVRLSLQARLSNRSAIGTRIQATFNPTVTTEISGGSGGGSMNDFLPLIGAGSATALTTLSVRWPNGTVSTLGNVATNQTVSISEPTIPDIFTVVPTRVLTRGGRALTITGQNLNLLNSLSVSGTPVTNLNVVNPTLATFTAPAKAAGVFDLETSLFGATTIKLIRRAIRYVDPVTRSRTIAGGTAVGNFEMFGVPLAQGMSSSDSGTSLTRLSRGGSILQQLISQVNFEDPQVARLFRFNGAAYDEGLSIPLDDIAEGIGFWGISRQTVTVTLTGGDTNQFVRLSNGSLSPSPPITLFLHPGWNQVSTGVDTGLLPGVAFVSTGTTQDVVGVTDTANSLTNRFFFEFTGDPSNPYRVASTLDGGRAYWLFNFTSSSLVLLFGDPRASGVVGTQTAVVSSSTAAFLSSDLSGTLLPASIKYAMTGNVKGIPRAVTRAEGDTPPAPPSAVIVNAGGGGGGGGGGCFIATAAYGASWDTRLRVLSCFRDARLAPAKLGRDFTATYYSNSPPLASGIRGRAGLRACTRRLIQPILQLAEPASR